MIGNYVQGPTDIRPVVAGDAVYGINPGDLLWLDLNLEYARPADAFPWQGNLWDTQKAFAQVFLGVAQGTVPAGIQAQIGVDCSPMSVYSFACNATQFQLGDTLALVQWPAQSRLYASTLQRVSNPERAIARAWTFTYLTVTTVQVQFASAFACGSGNAWNQLGFSEFGGP